MNESSAREEALALMLAKEARPVHVLHVAQLALQLFDQLALLHALGRPERLLLEVAACLHDIGHQVPASAEGHHKESARLIRGRRWMSFDGREVELIAQVARYHRKSIPELTHDEFRALPEWDRRIIQYLAALLRLADSFDRTHAQLVGSVRVELPVNRILFHLETTGPVPREVRAARQKGDLAALVFQRDLVFLSDGVEIVVPDEPAGLEPERIN